MKITVPIDWYTEPAPLVEGEILDIAPHLAHVGTFIVHRPAKGDWYHGWKVTHLESGFCVGQGKPTRKEAIDAATRKEAIDAATVSLSKIDDKKLLKMIKEAEKLKANRRRVWAACTTPNAQ